MQAQNSSSETGFQLLSRLSGPSCRILDRHMTQTILRNGREKSLLPLGPKEGKPALLTMHTEEEIDRTTSFLRGFEKDDRSLGLQSRFLNAGAKINIE